MSIQKGVLKSYDFKTGLLLLLIISMFSCKEATNEEKIKRNPQSAYQIMNSYAKNKNWNKFAVIGSIDAYNYVYKREENIYAQVGNINTYVGIIDLKNDKNRECLLENSVSEYMNSVQTIKKSTDGRTIALLSKKNDATLIVTSKADSSLYAVYYDYKFGKFQDKGFTLDGAKYKLNNIEFISSIYIDEDGNKIFGDIFNEKGEFLGKVEDVFSTTQSTRNFVDKIKDEIIKKELEKEIVSIWESFVSVSDLADEGAQNAMRFNDKYRHRTIKLKGTVLDVDEPWLSGYKYRVKMSGCTILANDRSVLELNKGEVGYIIGTCTNFDSNSYAINVVDGRALVGTYLGRMAGESLRESGRVDDIIKENEDYTLYMFGTLENPFVDNVQSKSTQKKLKDDLSKNDNNGQVLEKKIEGKGYIGKYHIEMSFSCINNKISGRYKYEGHTNYMTIKGEMKDNGDFTFSEYNEKDECFGTFTGHADFEQQKLSGVWINGETQLNFEVSSEAKDRANMNSEYQSELKDLIVYWNELHTDKLISSTSLECLYDAEVLFYGQTLSSKDCVSRIISIMKKYDSFSQTLEGDIQYTKIDNNTVRCDFIKRVETNGKYTNYSAYLIFKKEGNDWSIITESDAQTDAYFERNK